MLPLLLLPAPVLLLLVLLVTPTLARLFAEGGGSVLLAIAGSSSGLGRWAHE